MDKYKEVLERVAKKELLSSIILLAIIFLIIGSVWVCNYLYFKRTKKNHPKEYISKKQIKIRRQSIYASIILTIICICLGFFLCFDATNTILDINKDIEENEYITYIGSYSVDSELYYKHTLYDRWLTVNFDNDGYAFIYMDNFFEWISSKDGRFEGKVVYGKNSLIVVGIEN